MNEKLQEEAPLTKDHSSCELDHDDNNYWFCEGHDVSVCFKCSTEIEKGRPACDKHDQVPF